MKKKICASIALVLLTGLVSGIATGAATPSNTYGFKSTGNFSFENGTAFYVEDLYYLAEKCR